MRNVLKVSLLLTLVIFVQSKAKPKKKPVNLCTIPVALLIERSICHPLMKVWVVRDGKCKEARQCIKGYSKDECNRYCLPKPTTKSPCVFTIEFQTEKEDKVESTTQGIEKDIEGSTEMTTIRTRRTRRTRKPRVTTC